MTITLVSSSKHFGGTLAKYSHVSKATQCIMHFNVFLPKSAVESKTRVPVIAMSLFNSIIPPHLLQMRGGKKKETNESPPFMPPLHIRLSTASED